LPVSASTSSEGPSSSDGLAPPPLPPRPPVSSLGSSSSAPVVDNVAVSGQSTVSKIFNSDVGREAAGDNKKTLAPPAMKVGMLKKDGSSMFGSARTRHFVLLSTTSSSTLKYYVRPKSSPPFGDEEKGGLNLDGASVAIAGEYVVIKENKGKELKIEIAEPEERNSWFEAIHAHIIYCANSRESN
jgi:hypothetical protein